MGSVLPVAASAIVEPRLAWVQAGHAAASRKLKPWNSTVFVTAV
jgi:hypothetical protein